MKKIITLLLTAATLLVPFTLASRKDTIIPADKLPAEAQTFLKEYFPDVAVSYVKKDRDHGSTKYEVVLQDRTEIEFNSKGVWDNVDCKTREVPSVLVPSAIAGYVQDNFPGQQIVKIDKERYGYEIELSSDLELKFDKKGNLLRIDD